MKNLELAMIFRDIANILDIKNVVWKPRAYRQAATSLESLQKDVEEIYKDRGIKGLKQIPDVGEHIANKIEEYVKTGKIKAYDQLKKQTSAKIVEMMELEAVGPKLVKRFYMELGIKSISDLEKAAKAHKLRKLSGIREKMERNILDSIEIYKQKRNRMPLIRALKIANRLEILFNSQKFVKKAIVAGSVRRKKATIGDIDLLVVSNQPKKVTDFFISMPEVRKVLGKGRTKSSVVLKNALKVDLRVLKPDEYGAAVLYFTGNKAHNIILRRIAIKKGYKLNEYGLFDKKTNKRVAATTERKIYSKLRLKYVPPEKRHGTTEIKFKK